MLENEKKNFSQKVLCGQCSKMRKKNDFHKFGQVIINTRISMFYFSIQKIRVKIRIGAFYR